MRMAIVMMAACAGAAMGQEPGIPYRVATLESGVARDFRHANGFTKVGRDVAYTMEDRGEVWIYAYDPVTRVTRRVRAPKWPQIVGEVSGKLMVTGWEGLGGPGLYAVDLGNGSYERVAELNGFEEAGGLQMAMKLESVIALKWEKWRGSTTMWVTDGTRAGTRMTPFPNELADRVVVPAGDRVVYMAANREQVWAWDAITGEREGLLNVPRGWSWVLGSQSREGTAIVSVDRFVFETDGTRRGLHIIAEGVSSRIPVAIGNMMVIAGYDSILAAPREGGEYKRLVWVDHSIRQTERVGDRVLLADGEYQHHGVWSTDGTVEGTFKLIEDPGAFETRIFTDGGKVAYISLSTNRGIVSSQTDGTIEGTRRVEIPWGWLDWNGGPTVIGGRAYFAREGIGGPMVVDLDGVTREIGESGDRPAGVRINGGMYSGEGRFWFETIVSESPNFEAIAWSTTGAAGELEMAVHEPIDFHGGQILSDELNGPLFAVDRDGLMVRRVRRLTDPTREPETLARWSREKQQGYFQLAGGDGGWCVTDGYDALVTDGTPEGSRVVQIAERGTEYASATVVRAGDAFAVWRRWSDDTGVERTAYAMVSARGADSLGELEGSQVAFVMGGRVYVSKWDDTSARYELWMSEESGPLAPINGQWFEYPTFIGEIGDRAYFVGSNGTDHYGVWSTEVSDVALGLLREVARIDGTPGAWSIVGSRVLIRTGVSVGRLFSVDGVTGEVELVHAAVSSIEFARASGRTLLYGYDEQANSRQWTTDGTRAGTRLIPAPVDATMAWWPSGLTAGRFCFVAETREDGPQLYAVNLCAADHDGDGMLEEADYASFVGAFEAGATSADMDGDGFVDVFDYLAYVAAFDAGC